MLHSSTSPIHTFDDVSVVMHKSKIDLPPIHDVSSLHPELDISNNKNKRKRFVSDEADIRPPPSRPVKRTKQVRFSDNNTVQALIQDPEVKRLCWIRKQEMEMSRSRSKGLAQEISTTNHMKDHALSYKNVLENVYKHALQGKQPSDLKALLVWVSQGHSRRGLERWSLPTLGWHRQERRAKLVETLMMVQQQNVDKKEQVLSRLSRHYSKPARVFAYALGQADAHAASGDCI